jgi:hypothetical protein
MSMVSWITTVQALFFGVCVCVLYIKYQLVLTELRPFLVYDSDV